MDPSPTTTTAPDWQDLVKRQIWAVATSSTTTCDVLTFKNGGVLAYNSETITLTANAVFTPTCTGGYAISADDTEPFYASTSPQIYAIATATVVAYLLVIILFITPRTFYHGASGGGSGLLGRRGGSSGNSSIIGVGTRPWLQKVAALSVAVSLTIASADTFRVSKRQYEQGYQDASALTAEVIGGTEISAIQIVSGFFLWLAQVQTLIRLFPRQKEKVIIKWSGFALILLDTIFSILNNFVHQSTKTAPRSYVDAIPALAYLFELALSLFYCASVNYYGMSKRRYAFFHPKMRNIFLVALLANSAVLVPVVFFVLDISKPDVAGWGDYIRWVGAAAGSVVVWEWVERIEVLERDERKDGILGRELFDGDEMLDMTPSEEVDWPRKNGGGHRGPGPGGSPTAPNVTGWSARVAPIRSRVGFHSRRNAQPRQYRWRDSSPGEVAGMEAVGPTPPPVAITPVSRTDTTSAASTVYAVRYHTITSPSPPVNELEQLHEQQSQEARAMATGQANPAPSETTGTESDMHEKLDALENNSHRPPMPQKKFELPPLLMAVPNLFRRQRTSPPQEVATALAHNNPTGQDEPQQATIPDNREKDAAPRWQLKTAFGQVYSSQKDRFKNSVDRRFKEQGALQVTVIPAQRRGQSSEQVVASEVRVEGINAADASPLPDAQVTDSPQSLRGPTNDAVQPAGQIHPQGQAHHLIPQSQSLVRSQTHSPANVPTSPSPPSHIENPASQSPSSRTLPVYAIPAPSRGSRSVATPESILAFTASKSASPSSHLQGIGHGNADANGTGTSDPGTLDSTGANGA